MHKSTFTFFLFIQVIFGTVAWAQNGVKIEWQALTPMPESVGGHMSAWCGKELFVIGGTNWKGGVKIFADVWAYSPEQKSWRRALSLPQPVAYGVAQSTFDGIEIESGLNHDKILSDVYHFSQKANRWEQEKDLPLSIAFAGGGIVQGKALLVGGAVDLQKSETYNPYLWKREGGKWQRLSKMPGVPCVLFASASTKQGLYLFGGMTYQNDHAQNLDDAWFYDAKKNAWKSLQHLPIAARGMAACAISAKYILLVGGYSDTYLHQVLLYDVKKDSYSELTPLPYAAMGLQMVYAKGCVYVTGGEDAPRHRSNLFFVGQVKNLP